MPGSFAVCGCSTSCGSATSCATTAFFKARTGSADLIFVSYLWAVPHLWAVPEIVVVPQIVVVAQIVVVPHLGRHPFFLKARTSSADLIFVAHLVPVPHPCLVPVHHVVPVPLGLRWSYCFS